MSEVAEYRLTLGLSSRSLPAVRKIVSPPSRTPLLGDLEVAVMHRVWADEPVDVKAVHRAIGVPRRITLNTVQSTIERLYRKGLLDRQKVSHAYVYSARVSRAELATRLAKDVVSTVAGSDVEVVLAAFVSMVERAGEQELDRLQRLIEARRAGGEPPR